MHRAGAIAVAVIALAVPACGGEPFTEERAVASFQAANPDADLDASRCVVDHLIAQYGLEELEAQLAADPLRASFEEAQFRAMFRCGLEGDVEDQITTQLEENGVSPDDAPCVAAELVGAMTDDDIDVLLSGVITDDFSTKFLEAMETCGALNP
ncbi:MAG: hypothetical protein AAGK32_02775 [Actinomycetota bacterium]